MHLAILGTRGIPARYGGFETCAEEISVRLVEQGHQVTVYCRASDYDSSLKMYKGVSLVQLPCIPGKVTETFSHTFLSILHCLFIGADVIYVMNAANGPLCLIPRVMGKIVVVNVDGLEWKRRKWGTFAKKYYLFSEWICSKVATRIISDAIGIKDYYLKKYNTDSTYIAYGADIESSVNSSVLEEYDLEPDNYLLIASRLEPENNADMAIEAFEKVRSDKKLVIAGGANYDSEFIRKIRATRDPRIEFLGPVYKEGHIKELHCGCFAYIHGNEVGGTNPALLKAMGYGNMVFGFDNVFNNEVLGESGIAYCNAIDLAKKIQQVVDSPESRDSYRKKAVTRIKSYYTWDKITFEYVRLFESLIAYSETETNH